MLKNIPALDGVRGLAILLVLVFHWFPSTHWINTLPNGPLGVTLFFVLSGFLITQILLKNKEKNNLWQNLKNFWARRALRIFPIYYTTLFVIALLYHAYIAIPTDFYHKPLPYFFYFYNHLLESTGNWNDQLSPYWSLAVEEQFYLFWPLFILLLPHQKNRLLTLFLGLILLGILARYYFIWLHGGVGVTMITCVDCFAWGGLLAYCRHQGIQVQQIIRIGIIPIGILWVYIGLNTTDQDLLKVLFFRSSTSMLAFALIHSVLSPNAISRIFQWRPLKEIGKISYGLYLYHMVVPHFVYLLLGKLGIQVPASLAHYSSAIILFTFSYLSYFLLEKPLLRLKKHFE